MSYISLEVNCQRDFIEIFMAELAELGFSTFQEKENEQGFYAYMEENQQIEATSIQTLFGQYKDSTEATFHLDKVEKENWNEDWEKNYQPIEIDDTILVRADFHPSNTTFLTEIIVTPKMSFGTGHHETTYQMLKLIDGLDLKGKNILDAGCGTGILGILSAIKGATKVDAYDVDGWAVENTIENFRLNSIAEAKYRVWQGEVSTIPSHSIYEVAVANINKNILLADIQHLQKHLTKDGYLILSGFYKNDIEDILNECTKFSLQVVQQSVKNKWSALLLKKNK